jgi:hypothetical protein
MEQQLLKWIANKKERNRVRKEEELERKHCEEEQHCEDNKMALVLPAQPPEEATMQFNQPNPGITTLLSDMMQGNTANEEGERIDPKTRSPPKNKQKNNAPTLKLSVMTAASPEKTSIQNTTNTSTSIPKS